MKTITKTIIALAASTVISQADITVKHGGENKELQDYSGSGSAVIKRFTPPTSENAVVYLILNIDGDGKEATAVAKYGKHKMTRVDHRNRTAIFYYILTDKAPTTITIAGSPASKVSMTSWGVVSGVDTANIKTSTGSGYVDPIQSMHRSLTGLSKGDVIISTLSMNNSATPVTAGNGSILGTAYEGGETSFDAINQSHTMTSAGAYKATATQGSSGNITTGVALAFTAAK